MNFFLVSIVTGLAAFVAYFGNGLIYGLSAKFIDANIPAQHRYTAYNLPLGERPLRSALFGVEVVLRRRFGRLCGPGQIVRGHCRSSLPRKELPAPWSIQRSMAAEVCLPQADRVSPKKRCAAWGITPAGLHLHRF